MHKYICRYIHVIFDSALNTPAIYQTRVSVRKSNTYPDVWCYFIRLSDCLMSVVIKMLSYLQLYSKLVSCCVNPFDYICKQIHVYLVIKRNTRNNKIICNNEIINTVDSEKMGWILSIPWKFSEYQIVGYKLFYPDNYPYQTLFELLIDSNCR